MTKHQNTATRNATSETPLLRKFGKLGTFDPNTDWLLLIECDDLIREGSSDMELYQLRDWLDQFVSA